MFGHLNGQLLCSQWPGISVQQLFEPYSFLEGGGERERERERKFSKGVPDRNKKFIFHISSVYLNIFQHNGRNGSKHA